MEDFKFDIVCIDDETYVTNMFRSFMSVLFEDRGFKIQTYNNPYNAQQDVKFKDLSAKIWLIDIMMPGGISGAELAQVIRQKYGNQTHIYAFTALNPQVIKEMYADDIFDGAYNKTSNPINMTLNELVNSHFGSGEDDEETSEFTSGLPDYDELKGGKNSIVEFEDEDTDAGISDDLFSGSAPVQPKRPSAPIVEDVEELTFDLEIEETKVKGVPSQPAGLASKPATLPSKPVASKPAAAQTTPATKPASLPSKPAAQPLTSKPAAAQTTPAAKPASLPSKPAAQPLTSKPAAVQTTPAAKPASLPSKPAAQPLTSKPAAAQTTPAAKPTALPSKPTAQPVTSKPAAAQTTPAAKPASLPSKPAAQPVTSKPAAAQTTPANKPASLPSKPAAQPLTSKPLPISQGPKPVQKAAKVEIPEDDTFDFELDDVATSAPAVQATVSFEEDAFGTLETETSSPSAAAAVPEEDIDTTMAVSMATRQMLMGRPNSPRAASIPSMSAASDVVDDEWEIGAEPPQQPATVIPTKAKATSPFGAKSSAPQSAFADDEPVSTNRGARKPAVEGNKGVGIQIPVWMLAVMAIYMLLVTAALIYLVIR